MVFPHSLGKYFEKPSFLSNTSNNYIPLSEQYPIELPELPAEHCNFLEYCHGKPVEDVLGPYLDYESKMREIFAQQPYHPKIDSLTIMSLFNEEDEETTVEIKAVARRIAIEDQEKLIMSSIEEYQSKMADIDLAVVPSLKEFRENFNEFSHSLLSKLDWSNIVVAGGAATIPLLPKTEDGRSKIYYQIHAPTSDVDIFLYGMEESQAIEKIKSIVRSVAEILGKTVDLNVIRTKNAITILGTPPHRHVQIVLRLYRSISEILAGFDVDCACVAYDGKQVYASPRGLAACRTRINTVDLTRRSPSYENRLSKYASRGFGIYCPGLDRSQVSPIIYERDSWDTVGLARLLVLEKKHRLKIHDMEKKVDLVTGFKRPERRRRQKRKDYVVEEGLSESNYSTFEIPGGSLEPNQITYRFKCMDDDLNRRDPNSCPLHRHPGFTGSIDQVLDDCCKQCPSASNNEKLRKLATSHDQKYVSGELKFVVDNPGRQTIGSFDPLEPDDWYKMA